MSNNKQAAFSASLVEVKTDCVITKDLKITGQPAQRIIEGTLQGIAPLETITKLMEFGAIALDAVQSESMRNHLEAATENFGSVRRSFQQWWAKKPMKTFLGLLKRGQKSLSKVS